MKTVEYLTELLNKRDVEIETLSERVEELEHILNGDTWGWTIHGEMTEEENMDLPVPRLEMRWVPLDNDRRGYNWAALYRLVHRHFLGHLVYIPFGYTRVGSGGEREPVMGDDIELPFRDGAHIKSDARELGLPAFVILRDRVQRIFIGTGEAQP